MQARAGPGQPHGRFIRASAGTRDYTTMATLGLILIAVVALALAVIIGGAISVLRVPRRDAGPVATPSGLPARVLCPILGEVTRVRLGQMPEDGRLGVIWCERFGDAALRCDRSCFGAAIAGSLA